MKFGTWFIVLQHAIIAVLSYSEWKDDFHNTLETTIKFDNKQYRIIDLKYAIGDLLMLLFSIIFSHTLNSWYVKERQDLENIFSYIFNNLTNTNLTWLKKYNSMFFKNNRNFWIKKYIINLLISFVDVCYISVSVNPK